jgi:hypothetical protein
MAYGDLNGDKYPDVVVPGDSPDLVWALNGENGLELWSHPTGNEVNCVAVYDVDYDGDAEVIAGSDDQYIYVLSGASGDVEWSYTCSDDVMHLGVGDISGDLLPNIVCITFGSDGIMYAFESLADELPNENPVAVIDSIAPAPAPEGGLVQFGGHGEDTDGSIAASEWTSNLDGFLSGQADFSSAALSRGKHQISYRVQDDDDAWSEPVTDSIWVFLCGDVDQDDIVNISDAVFLIAYIFGGGPPAEPEESGDVDCNGLVNISDAVFLIGYIFSGGPEPCSDCI